MIHIKTCKECGELYDIENCPFCRNKKELVWGSKEWNDKWKEEERLRELKEEEEDES